MTPFFGKFQRFEKHLLEVADEPILSPEWWQPQFEGFFDAYESGTLSWYCAAGRGSAKSTAIYKLALFFALHGNWDIPKSQTHYAMVLSRVKVEAAKGLAIVSHWLTKIGIPFRSALDTIEINGTGRGVRIVSASVAAASGWRCFMVCGDEYDLWPVAGDAGLDSEEVLSSAKAMTATHPKAISIVASSPWIEGSPFWKVFHQNAAPDAFKSGPVASWVANPACITEAGSHKKEPDDRRWRRQYKCEWSATYFGGFFPDDAITRATDIRRSPTPDAPDRSEARYMIAIDPALSRDSWATAIAHGEYDTDGSVRVTLDYIGAFTPPAGGSLSAELCVDRCCELRLRWMGTSDRTIFSDQWSGDFLAEAFGRRSIGLKPESWTQDRKVTLFSFFRNLLIDKRLRLPDDPELRKEMSGVGISLTRSANEHIDTGRLAHDDRVHAAVHAVWLAHRYPSGRLMASINNQHVDLAAPFVAYRDGTIFQGN